MTSLVTKEDLLWVGLDTGRIFSLDPEVLIPLNEVTSGVKAGLQKINKLYLKSDEDKLYSIHENFIAEWNIKLNSCLHYIEYFKPQAMIKIEEAILIVGPSTQLSVLKDKVSELQLSMRGTGVICSLGDRTFAVGGVNNLIDVWSNDCKVMTLIAK